jgi:DNA-binding IscR family transcriptional regulator
MLHTLRCLGFASAARVADVVGVPPADAESELIDLGVAGLVTHERGEFGGWGLTEAGRAHDAAHVAEELAASGADAAVRSAYDDFVVLNPELLDLCTAWQLRTRDGVPTANDHSDADYDSRVIARLVAFDERAEEVCGRLAAALGRFASYSRRLDHALRRVVAGEHDYVADAMESYHSVWFQLHEDLLVTLGIPRD